MLKTISIIFIMLLLSGCNKEDVLSDNNEAPFANAGSNQTVSEGNTVSFSASESSDSDGSISSYEWNEGTTTLSTNFTFSKSNFSVGTHTITLKVTDDDGLTDSDTVVITIIENETTTRTITHNSTTYETIISSVTGKTWLDRNLGASRACTSFDDEECYGDYYQWGRDTDGHEKSNSLTTLTQATDVNSAGSSFITFSSSYSAYDWAGNADSDASIRSLNWSKTDGSSVCPIGFRVPTKSELEAENISDMADAYSKLKLTSAGYRNSVSGLLDNQVSYGFLWSSSPDGTNSGLLKFGSSSAEIGYLVRANGFSVRCMKDNTSADTTPPTFTSNSTASVTENQKSAITLSATDASTITYSISGTDSTSFDVNSSSGIVTFKTAPDYETKQNYSFSATATDASNNSSTQSVAITITDVIESTESITHNGTTYETIISSLTGKTWLDRNLGASRACTSFDDEECYGDYYQWGRNTDGHEKSNSLTTLTQATDVNSVGSSFITFTSTHYDDWAENADSDGSIRSLNWSKTDGSSVCPVGYRVPTLSEIEAENISNSSDAYTKLKLPSAGYRHYGTGNVYDQGSGGRVWSSSISSYFSNRLYFYSSFADTYSYGRGTGYSVRCLED